MRPPRCAIARSTSCATRIATATVTIAVMPARWSVQNEAATMGREAIETRDRDARASGRRSLATRRRALAAALGPERYAALRDAALAFVLSRAIVWVTAVWAAALL